MAEDQAQSVELQVRKILDEEAGKYRDQLYSQFRHVVWAVALVFAVGIAAGAYLFGKDAERSRELLNATQEQIKASIDDKIISYRILDTFQQRLDVLAASAVASPSVTKILEDKAEEIANSRVSEFVSSRIAKEFKRLGTQQISSLVSRAVRREAAKLTDRNTLVPKGTVAAFVANACPEGWAPSQVVNEFFALLRSVTFTSAIDKLPSSDLPERFEKVYKGFLYRQHENRWKLANYHIGEAAGQGQRAIWFCERA